MFISVPCIFSIVKRLFLRQPLVLGGAPSVSRLGPQGCVSGLLGGGPPWLDGLLTEGPSYQGPPRLTLGLLPWGAGSPAALLSVLGRVCASPGSGRAPCCTLSQSGSHPPSATLGVLGPEPPWPHTPEGCPSSSGLAVWASGEGGLHRLPAVSATFGGQE